LDKDSTLLAWKSVLTARCKNFPEGTVIFSWQSQQPEYGPLGRLMGYEQPIPFESEINAFWKALGPEIREKYYEQTQTVLAARQKFPPEPDATSIVLTVIGHLLDAEDKHSDEVEILREQLTSYNAYSDRLNKTVYRPFINLNYDPDAMGSGSRDPRDIIDSRSYFVLHPYLKEKKEEAEANGEIPDIRIGSTLLISQDEVIPEVMELFFTNASDLDTGVMFSFLRGITVLVLSGAQLLEDMNQTEFFSEDLQKTYLDTSECVHWLVENDMLNKHPDISTGYIEFAYPYMHFDS